MNHPQATQVFRRMSLLPFRTLDGETVIVHPEQRQVHVLNGTASRIWEMLEDWQSLPSVVAALAREGEFDAAPEVVDQDVLQFLDELIAKGLVSDGQLAVPSAASAG